MIETLAQEYSSDSTQLELSYEYPQDLIKMIFIFVCKLVHWMKVTSASDGLVKETLQSFPHQQGP